MGKANEEEKLEARRRKPVRVRINPALGMQPYERLKMAGVTLAPGETALVEPKALEEANADKAWLVPVG